MYKIIGNDEPCIGYVLEKESDTKYALNYYKKERRIKRLTVRNIDVFDVDTIGKWHLEGLLNQKIMNHTKGKRFVIREAPTMINF